MKKKLIAIAIAFSMVFALGACGRSIDVQTTGAVAVPGARGLHYFCHGPTLIYVSIWDGTDDVYEAMWPGWCLFDPATGKWTYAPEKLKDVPAARTDGNVQEDDK